jgi:ribosomal protein S18 acetylase RimI-like enzyme
VDDLALRALEQHEWPAAMRLSARSSLNEPYMVEMFGKDPIRRFALANRHYQSTPWYDDQQKLAAFVGDRLVGYCVCSAPGHCHVCTDTDRERPPDDELRVADWRWKVNVQAAHADHDAHGWISSVAVDPVLHGAGIGRALMSQAIASLRADGAHTVLLECQGHRETFYLACGFHRVRTFPDPVGPDALLMCADL